MLHLGHDGTALLAHGSRDSLSNCCVSFIPKKNYPPNAVWHSGSRYKPWGKCTAHTLNA